jgi:hypothetical protein
MKCPECDLEQPENTSICAGCGLSFEMWRQHNPGADLSTQASPKEMAFPDPEEEGSAIGISSPEKEPPAKKDSAKPASSDDGDSSRGPGSGTVQTTEDFSSKDKPTIMEKGGFRLSHLHFAVLGFALVAILGLAAFFLRHRTPRTALNSGVMNPQPTVNLITASTPSNGTPAASAMIGGTPGVGTSNQGNGLGNSSSTKVTASPNSSAQTPVPALQAAPVTAAPDKMSSPYTSTPVPSPTAPESSASAAASAGASSDTPTPVPAAAAPAVEMTSPTPTANPDFWK